MSAVEVRGTGVEKAAAAVAEACQMLAERLAMAWETIRASLRRLAIRLVDFLVEHQPRRIRSGRWRVRLPGSRTCVYRSRALALAALRRSLIAAGGTRDV